VDAASSPAAAGLPSDLDGFRAAVLAWYDVERRPLPFRGTKDPYLVLVSEAMAQQTQIARVAEAWRRFVERFPTVAALAVAPRDEVLRAWAGLGYNRRAVLLHRAAQVIVAEHAGRVPDDPAVLETLPGIGPYTARAVAAIAFGRPVGPVDTNVRRVLSRVAGLEPPIAVAAMQALADAAVPPARAADWTAALMDVGARHCRPRPECDGCPIRGWCAVGRSDARSPATRRARPRRRATSFEATSRWLRGRIVDLLRDEEGDGWRRLETPIGGHDEAAVAAALAALERDGLVDRDPLDPALARLARG
jgi:A/G-specific adenine glycosylase